MKWGCFLNVAVPYMEKQTWINKKILVIHSDLLGFFFDIYSLGRVLVSNPTYLGLVLISKLSSFNNVLVLILSSLDCNTPSDLHFQNLFCGLYFPV